MDMLNEVKADITAEDYMRAEYVIGEVQRVMDVCAALEKVIMKPSVPACTKPTMA
jgi:galactokinase